MSTPVVFIFRARIQQGKLDGYREYAKEHAAFAERTHPGVLAFHLFLSEDQREVAAVQVHPDADSMDIWMKEVVSTHGETAYQFLEPGSERALAFGTLHDHTLEGMRQYGIELDLNPEHLAGFTRLGAP